MKKVLVVDDDEDFLFIIAEYLSMNGIECDRATSASQALKRIFTSNYDMVLSDLQMPGESGLELFGLLSNWRPELPFILMTGNLDPWIRREALRKGVWHFLQKPFELHLLKRLLANPGSCKTKAGMEAPAA